MNQYSKPIETTEKVRTYINNLIKAAKEENLSIKEKIDIAALLDDIQKKSKAFVDKLKKQLEPKKGESEIEGTIARARFSEKISITIPPIKFYNEVTPEIFIKCVKVGIKEAKEVLPENRIKAIAIEGVPIKQVSLQLKNN